MLSPTPGDLPGVLSGRFHAKLTTSPRFLSAFDHSGYEFLNDLSLITVRG
jgi:hypothetical protein